jgi:hypothetical protein
MAARRRSGRRAAVATMMERGSALARLRVRAPETRLPRSPEVEERRISVGFPQLLHDQAPDVVRRYAVRAEELGLARLGRSVACPVAQPREFLRSTGRTSSRPPPR